MDNNKNNQATMQAPSGFSVVAREFRKDKLALTSLGVLIGIILFIIIYHIYIRVTGQYESIYVTDILSRFKPMGEDGYLLGTDGSGRSVFAWLILGTGNSMLIGTCVTIITMTVGSVVAMIISYYGGNVDAITMRIVDFLVIVPRLMIIIVFVSVVPNYGVFTFILVLSAFAWMGTTRLIRSKALAESRKDYVLASKTMGTSDLKIIFSNILPNIMSLIIIDATLTLAANMGIEVGLSFLGFGLPIGTPSIGTLLSYARDADIMVNRLNIWLPAAIMILVLMLSINYVGQALRRSIDAKQRL